MFVIFSSQRYHNSSFAFLFAIFLDLIEVLLINHDFECSGEFSFFFFFGDKNDLG